MIPGDDFPGEVNGILRQIQHDLYGQLFLLDIRYGDLADRRLAPAEQP
ncbi:MAG TPA: hypothetical protein VJP78_09685 [Thermoleophilia bacterium]|nr:hypothetical protein [Thermoleophilia bacterium]